MIKVKSIDEIIKKVEEEETEAVKSIIVTLEGYIETAYKLGLDGCYMPSTEYNEKVKEAFEAAGYSVYIISIAGKGIRTQNIAYIWWGEDKPVDTVPETDPDDFLTDEHWLDTILRIYGIYMSA